MRSGQAAEGGLGAHGSRDVQPPTRSAVATMIKMPRREDRTKGTIVRVGRCRAGEIQRHQVHFWLLLPLQVASTIAAPFVVPDAARHRAVAAVGRIVLLVPNVQVCALVPLQRYVQIFWPATKCCAGTSKQLPSTRSELSAGKRVRAWALVLLQP